jgi:hypothetical protein
MTLIGFLIGAGTALPFVALAGAFSRYVVAPIGQREAAAKRAAQAVTR